MAVGPLTLAVRPRVGSEVRRCLRRAAVWLLALGGVALTSLGLALGAEAWTGARSLPPWAPSPPYWLGRALTLLPGDGIETLPMKWLRLSARWPRPAVALPPWTALQVRALTGLSPGGYQGWTDGHDGRLALHGHPCTAEDPLVALTLNLGAGEVPVGLRHLSLTEVANGAGYTLPVTLIEAPLPAGDYAPTATARCRSGREARHALGAAQVLEAPGNPAGLELRSASSLGHAGLPAELVLFNPGPGAVRLEAAHIGPRAASSGRVLAGAGSLELVARWRAGIATGALTGAGAVAAGPRAAGTGATGAAAPVTGATGAVALTAPPAAVATDHLSPWDAAFRTQDDPRNLLLRPAHDLALDVAPNEYAIIAVTTASFHETRPALPQLFYPLVEYVTDALEPGGLVVRDELMAGWSGR